MLAYSLMKLMSRIACVQPTCFNDALAYALGQIGWLATPKWRRYMAKENVKECLGVSETEAERIAKESVTRFGRMLIEVLRYPLINQANFRNLVHFEGLEHLEEAYAEGRGVIMCTAHYGNWEMLGASMALLGYPILSITRKQNDGRPACHLQPWKEQHAFHRTLSKR